MRKVTFTIDDLEYFKRKFSFTDRQMDEFFGDSESFMAIYTLVGEGNHPDKYELTDYNGNKISLEALNGYQKGVWNTSQTENLLERNQSCMALLKLMKWRCKSYG